MKHFDFRHMSYERLVYAYKKMKRQIRALTAENNTMRNYKNGKLDSIASLYQQMDTLEELVIKLERENPNNPNNPDSKTTLIDDEEQLIPTSDHTVSYGDKKTDYITSIPVVKGKCYTLIADVVNGNTFSLTQYPVSRSNSDLDNPTNKKDKLVKFVGKNVDNDKSMQVQLTFVPRRTRTLYVKPSAWNEVDNFKLFRIDLPDTRSSIPVPKPNKSTTDKVDKDTIHFLQNLIKELKNKSVIISGMNHVSDENGGINYTFSAEPVQPQYNFLDASNKLNQFNGMKRASNKKDYWIELSPSKQLVIKYRGTSQLYPYQPSSKDLRAKDWIVEYVRPFNPDTKPKGSDPYDDATDFNLYGWDGDPYTFLEDNDD